MSVVPLGGQVPAGGRSSHGGRLVMLAPGQVPDGAQVVAVVALVPDPGVPAHRPVPSLPSGRGRATAVPPPPGVRVPPGARVSPGVRVPPGVRVSPGVRVPRAPEAVATGSSGRPGPGLPQPLPRVVGERTPPRPIGPGLLLDLEGRRLLVDGQSRELTRREFDLLAFLATRPGRVLTRAQLLAAVWAAADVADAGPRTVDVHVARLRRKLGRHLAPLTTLRGVGYRWSVTPEVTGQ